MKTVLAPIDFSAASANALSFAAELCKRPEARLVIIHIALKEGDEAEMTGKLESIQSELKETFGSDLKCEGSFAHGNLIPTLKKIIAVQQPDLVVMGTKGASGLKTIIGSNTVKLIGNTRVPVLVIPEVARFGNFLRNEKNRIVLATDLEELESDDALEVLKEIASFIIEPKIRVLSVRPKDTILPDVKRMERDSLLSFFNPEIESERFTVFSNNVISGINFYLKQKQDVGLLAMIARDSGRLIQKHYTREMASHTHLPLLVLHESTK